MKATIHLDLAALHAVADFDSKDQTRYVLNGVCFDIKTGKLQLLATDGRRMIRHRPAWLYEGGGRVVVPSLAIALLPKTGKWTLDIGDKICFLGPEEMRLECNPVEGSFPDDAMTSTYLPEDTGDAPPPGHMTAVNYEFYGSIMAAAKALGRTNDSAIRISQADIHAPVHFAFHNTLIALMPMRVA